MTLSDTSFAFVDVETTGGNAVYERVIEIAVIIMEKNKVTRKWSTLVNPERNIPGMIQSITGISNRDVEYAPTFDRIASELFELLDGKVFVAHNARFDYGFIRNEFKRSGISFTAKTLCTVRLSRVLYPRFRNHNLDSIIDRHGFTCENRHRALDDTRVLTDFWHLAQKEKGEEQFEWCVSSLLKRPSLPSNLSASSIEALPDGAGVYLFYGKGDRPIYIGKSVGVRTRVLSHFSGDHSLNKDMVISQKLRRIEYRETVGELGALLLESQLIKEHLPLYNTQLRRRSSQCAIRLLENDEGFDEVSIVSGNDVQPNDFQNLYGMFRGERSATDRLVELAEAYTLCPRKIGLEKDKKNEFCFGYHLKKCKGACGGEEEFMEHNLRLRMALSGMRHKVWPFDCVIGIKETNVLTDQEEIHLIDNWCYLGTYKTQEELQEALEGTFEPSFNIDNYRIIASFLKSFPARKKTKGECTVEVIKFPRKEKEKVRRSKKKDRELIMV
jgi:DNA polymerase-3 subunit epsilon